MAALRFISITLAVCAYALSSSHCIGLSQEASTPSASPSEVKLILTITDPPGRYVDGLEKERVTVFDNDVPQDLTTFDSSNIPFSVGLLFNVSKGRYVELLHHTAKPLLTVFEWEQKAKQGVNDYFIMGFNNEEFLAADWTTRSDKLSSGFNKLASLKPYSKNAALYDALEAGLRKIDTATHFKRALVMITDSRETGRGLKREMLMDSLRRSNVLLYIIYVKENPVFEPSPFERALRPLCSVTGGFVERVPNAFQIEDLLEKIKLELNHQYLIGFIPNVTSSTERKWHRLRFDVKPLMLKQSSSQKSKKVELSARGREGYYP